MKIKQSQTYQIYSSLEHPSSYIHYPRYHLEFLLYSILEYTRLILHRLITQTFVVFQRPTNQLLVLHWDHQEPYGFSETYKPNLVLHQNNQQPCGFMETHQLNLVLHWDNQ